MKTSTAIGFKLLYANPSTGETEQVYAQKTVPIENYSAEWYAQRCCRYPQAGILGLPRQLHHVHAANNDYSKTTKEVRINAKGYPATPIIWSGSTAPISM